MILDGILCPQDKNKEKQLRILEKEITNLFENYKVAWNNFCEKISPKGEIPKLEKSILNDSVEDCLEEIDDATKILEEIVSNVGKEIQIEKLMQNRNYRIDELLDKLTIDIFKYSGAGVSVVLGILAGVLFYRKFKYEIIINADINNIIKTVFEDNVYNIVNEIISKILIIEKATENKWENHMKKIVEVNDALYEQGVNIHKNIIQKFENDKNLLYRGKENQLIIDNIEKIVNEELKKIFDEKSEVIRNYCNIAKETAKNKNNIYIVQRNALLKKKEDRVLRVIDRIEDCIQKKNTYDQNVIKEESIENSEYFNFDNDSLQDMPKPKRKKNNKNLLENLNESNSIEDVEMRESIREIERSRRKSVTQLESEKINIFKNNEGYNVNSYFNKLFKDGNVSATKVVEKDGIYYAIGICNKLKYIYDVNNKEIISGKNNDYKAYKENIKAENEINKIINTWDELTKKKKIMIDNYINKPKVLDVSERLEVGTFYRQHNIQFSVNSSADSNMGQTITEIVDMKKIDKRAAEAVLGFERLKFIEESQKIRWKNIKVGFCGIGIAIVLTLFIDSIITLIENAVIGSKINKKLQQMGYILVELKNIMQKETADIIKLTQEIEDGVIWLDENNILVRSESKMKIVKIEN
ncbi:MAG: hypothetical protein ACRCSG_07070 [Cellulosilyticaceae bacterium]